MKMNNNRCVTGFYIWSNAAEYTKGDFVVEGECIYRCVEDVTGTKPSEDREHFQIYPGEMISSADDYFKFVEESKNDTVSPPEDKFISMHALYDILQRLYFGIDINGVVNNYVLKKEDGIDFLVNGVTDLDKAEQPIDVILQSPTLNNGVLKVSREFFPGLFISQDKLSSEVKNYYSIAEDNSTIILRQYTYDYVPKDGETVRRRTQELIDPVFGDMFARYIDIKKEKDKDGKEKSSQFTSEWKRLSIGSGNNWSINTVMNTLHNTYQEMYKSYREGLSKEGSYFKTVYPDKIKLANSEANYYPHPEGTSLWINDCSGAIDDGAINLGQCLYTIVVSTKLKNGMYKNNSITIDGLELNNSEKKYYLSDTTTLLAKKEKKDGQGLGIAFTVENNTDVANAEIVNIYYKKDYNE